MVLKASTMPTETLASTLLVSSAEISALLSDETVRLPAIACVGLLMDVVVTSLLAIQASELPSTVLVAITRFRPRSLAATVLMSIATIAAFSWAVTLTSPPMVKVWSWTEDWTSLRKSLRTTSPPKAAAPSSDAVSAAASP